MPVVRRPARRGDETFFVNLIEPDERDDRRRRRAIGHDHRRRPAAASSIDDVTRDRGQQRARSTATFTVSSRRRAARPSRSTSRPPTAAATAPGDYAAASGTLTFAPARPDEDGHRAGQRRHARRGRRDLLRQPLERRPTRRSPTAGARHDHRRRRAAGARDQRRDVTEGNAGTATHVHRQLSTPPSGRAVTVDFATADGTATAPADYVADRRARSPSPPGETTKTVTVAGQRRHCSTRPTRRSSSTSRTPINATIADAQGIGTIIDDDAQPSLSVNDVTVTEGNAGTAPRPSPSRSGAAERADRHGRLRDRERHGAPRPATTPPTSGDADLRAGPDDEDDHGAVNGDLLDEATRRSLVNLSTPVNATIADGQGVGTITDDDAAAELAINDVTRDRGQRAARSPRRSPSR